MNKKLLIGTALASTLLFTSICVPKTFAAKIDGDGNKLTGCVNRLDDENLALYVVLSNNMESFTKANLDTLIKNKYSDSVTVTEVKKSDNTEISGDTEYVGTGSKVKLSSKFDEELTVVLYGDVDGNGKSNIVDVLAIKKHANNSDKITDQAKLKAGNLTGKNDEVNAVDALQLKYFTNKLLGKENYEKTIVSEAIYPGDLDPVNLEEKIEGAIKNIKTGNDAKLELVLDKDMDVVNFGVEANKTMEDYWLAGFGLITELNNQLQDPNIDNIEVTLGNASETLKLGVNPVEVAKALLNEAFESTDWISKEVDKGLIGKELVAKFNLTTDNGSEFVDTEKKSQEYTVKFVSIMTKEAVEAKAKTEVEKLNQDSAASDLFNTTVDNDKITFNVVNKDKTINDLILNKAGISALIEDLLDDKDISAIVVNYDGENYVFDNKETLVATAKELLNKMIGTDGETKLEKLTEVKDCKLTVKLNGVFEDDSKSVSEKTYTVNFTTENE